MRGQSITVKIVLTRGGRCQKWPDFEPSSRGAHVFDFAIRVYRQNNTSCRICSNVSKKTKISNKIQKTNRSRYYKPAAFCNYMLRVIRVYLQDTILYT